MGVHLSPQQGKSKSYFGSNCSGSLGCPSTPEPISVTKGEICWLTQKWCGQGLGEFSESFWVWWRGPPNLTSPSPTSNDDITNSQHVHATQPGLISVLTYWSQQPSEIHAAAIPTSLMRKLRYRVARLFQGHSADGWYKAWIQARLTVRGRQTRN